MFRTMQPTVLPVTLLIACLTYLPTTHAGGVFPGDIDGDGDVDNSDLAIIAGNDGLSPAFFSEGDVDGDSDVDSDDFAVAESDFFPSGFGDFFGVITSDTSTAQLTYNTSTGEVLLDQTSAPGGVISTFVLVSSSGSFTAPGTAAFPFGGGLFEDAATVISQSDPASYAPASGFSTNPHNLGAILPTGLDLAGLTSEVSQAVYVGLTGTGVREFDLVVVPEPTGCTLALAALCLAMSRRRIAAR
jgi:hypothetical protein